MIISILTAAKAPQMMPKKTNKLTEFIVTVNFIYGLQTRPTVQEQLDLSLPCIRLNSLIFWKYLCHFSYFLIFKETIPIDNRIVIRISNHNNQNGK